MLTIHQLIQNHAQLNPEQIAIFSTKQKNYWSYQDTAQVVTNVNQQLRRLGIKKNDRVGIFAPANSISTAIAILAISSSASCVVINPQLTSNELIAYLSKLSLKLLIYFPEYQDITAEIVNRLEIKSCSLTIDDRSLIIDANFNPVNSNQIDLDLATEDDIALIFSTSGTTGKVKLVPITHQSLYYCCQKTTEVLALANTDICLNVIPLYHVHGIISNFFLPLFSGGKVCLNGDFEPQLFLDWLAKSQATWYSVAPPIHQLILQTIKPNDLINKSLNLRFIRSGAASLPSKIITGLEKLLGVPLIEAYGMTEIPNLTSNRLQKRKLNSVGKSIGAKIKTIDTSSGNFLPQGEIGEIVVKGKNVIPYYLNDDQNNRHNFFAGWFKTGDRGYLDEDDYLFIEGRIKEIINRGGNNVAPQEIDNLLFQLPDIIEAVTFSIPHQSLGEDIITAVVLNSISNLNQEQINNYLSQFLANFKIPSQIIFVSQIPKSSTGKIQRFRLKEVFSEEIKQVYQSTYTPPRNIIEAKIVQIWQDVLQIEKIGIDDNFFVLGGHSIFAIQILASLFNLWQIDLPLRSLFEFPTIRQFSDKFLAEYIDLIITSSITKQEREIGEI